MKLTKRQQNSLLKKITKKCWTPADFCFEYVEDASIWSDIRRMKEYVRCVRKVEKEFKDKLK